MAKKMTGKEFKEVMAKVGMDFDLWGYEDVLNLISIALTHTSKEAHSHGFIQLAESDSKKADLIENILDKRGYYDSVKGA